jgi:acyl dehydratase
MKDSAARALARRPESEAPGGASGPRALRGGRRALFVLGARAARRDDPSKEREEMTEIRFDDIAGLSAQIKDDYSPWGPEQQVTQEMINAFADLTGDHQWIHVDVERCKRESPFGGPIAHGFLTLSLLPKLRTRSDFSITGYGNAVNYGANKLRFLAPVPAGAKLHARSRLMNVEAKPKGTLVANEIQVGIVGQETPALLYEMVVLYNPPRK